MRTRTPTKETHFKHNINKSAKWTQSMPVNIVVNSMIMRIWSQLF